MDIGLVLPIIAGIGGFLIAKSTMQSTNVKDVKVGGGFKYKIVIPAGTKLYRVQPWCGEKPGPMFYFLNINNFFDAINYRRLNVPEIIKKIVPSVRIQELPLTINIFKTIEPIELINFNKKYTYLDLENDILKLDTNYSKAFQTHRYGKVPEGDNWVPANWLNHCNSTENGWLDTKESNSFMTEVMLTEFGQRKIKLIEDLTDKEFFFKYLDDGSK
jgi:hypothetical protein